MARSRKHSSDFLPWSDRYKVGVRIIDTDHRNLFDIINTLHAGIEQGLTAVQLDVSIAGLARYVDEHFEREEGLMKQYAYPGFAKHREAHRDLIRNIYAIRKVQTAQPASIDLEKLMRFLGRWLVVHILRTDMDYVPYLHGEVALVGQPGPNDDASGGAGDDGSGEVDEEIREVTVRVPASGVEAIHRCALILRRGGEDARAIAEITDPISSMTLNEAMEICASVLKE